MPTPVFEAPAPVTETPAAAATTSARNCEACGAEIAKQRLRAMPRATRCLDCQRSAERTATAS